MSRRAILVVAAVGCSRGSDHSANREEPQSVAIPTGQAITPTAARGAIFEDLNPRHPEAPSIRAGQAAAVAISPDGRLLAILTSGYNLHFGPDGKPVPALSTESVFLFDVSGNVPKQQQVLPVPNTFLGLAWAPSSDRLFVAGGRDDDVLEFVREPAGFSLGRTFRLGHRAGVGVHATPVAGAVAVSPDGTRLLVANLQNDSVTLIDLGSGQVAAEQDLRPGIIDATRHGEPGGSFPRAVVWVSDHHAYVASERDREIIALEIARTRIDVVRRIPVHGQPVALVSNRAGTRLYSALDNTDRVAIVATDRDGLIEELNVVAPQAVYPNGKKLGGANSNALALTPDEGTLLVSNGGENAIAVVQLSDEAKSVVADRPAVRGDGDDDDDQPAPPGHSVVIGLVPTGWYPTGVATSKDGSTWYVINGKSPAGPNASWCRVVDSVRGRCGSKNPGGDQFGRTENGMRVLVTEDQYVHQLEKAGFLTVPAPDPVELARLTKQVAHNDRFDNPELIERDRRLFAFLREHIEHIIYVVKENRTYDQVLGDLEIGNGDPRLALFPERTSPNHHAIARNFTTLDNFLISGEVSWTGWDWSTAARTNDFRERQEPISMAERGLTGEKGLNRTVNVGYATSAERRAHDPTSPADPDVLPGTRDIYELDGPDGKEGQGYLWDAALRRGRTVRNWGFFGDHRGYRLRTLPLVRQPYAENLTGYFPTKAALMLYSDPYYRDFDVAMPDFWRAEEWKREFAEFARRGTAPNLMLVRLGNDHFGAFDQAIDGVDTPETQMADNDYALGRIVEAVARSPFARNTLIVAMEDDALDGPDHVDAFRSIVLFAGPYVRQRTLVSTRYTTVSVVRTIEEILGLEPVGLNDALAAPMADVFDSTVTGWSYDAKVPEVLRTTALPLPPATASTKLACATRPKRSSGYWTTVMARQDFTVEDRVDAVSFNQALWRGLRGDEPYPSTRTGADLRARRPAVLARMNRDDCSEVVR